MHVSSLLLLLACGTAEPPPEPEVLTAVQVQAQAPTSVAALTDAAAAAGERARQQEIAHPEAAIAPRVDDAVSAFAQRFGANLDALPPEARQALQDADPDLLDPKEEAIAAARRLQEALAAGDPDAAERAIAEGRVFGMPARLICIGQAAIGRLREGWTADRVMNEPVLDDPTQCPD